jgi:hypothetical protein
LQRRREEIEAQRQAEEERRRRVRFDKNILSILAQNSSSQNNQILNLNRVFILPMRFDLDYVRLELVSKP